MLLFKKQFKMKKKVLVLQYQNKKSKIKVLQNEFEEKLKEVNDQLNNRALVTKYENKLKKLEDELITAQETEKKNRQQIKNLTEENEELISKIRDNKK